MSFTEEMLREAANEVLQSRIPHGYVFIPDYDQYWSEEQRMYYDPNTELFSRPDDETVYQLSPDGTEFLLVERRKKNHWSSRCYRKRAVELIGEREFKKFDQESVNICEMALGMVDKVVREEEKEKEREYLRSIAHDKVAMIKHRFNKAFNENKDRRKKVSHKQYIPDESTGDYSLQKDEFFDWEDPCEANNEDMFSDDEEQAILMEQERFDQPPCMRVMDQKRQLHIITISGGYIGSDRDCEVVMSNQLMPERCAEVSYSEEASCYSIEKLESSCFLQVNGNTVEIDSSVDLCQGDFFMINGERFDVHVHFGNNTCAGCEPGLYQEPEKEETTQIQAKNIRGEYARRKNLKQMMKSYGIRPDEGLNEPIRKKPATGPSLQNIHRSDVPGPSGDMYGSCTAKPLPEGQRKFDLPSSSTTVPPAPKPLDSGNVGFKLLKSMGWSEGQGLGKEKQGHVEPVATEVKNNRQGLGKDKEQPKSYKDQILEKTKQRFNEKR